MNATKFISACAVLVALASCSSDHELSQQSAEVTPIRIQANVGGSTTRVAGTIQGTQFEPDEYINVYLFEKSGGTGTPASYGDNGLVVFKTSDANGNMSPSDPSGALYYPANGQSVLAYAFYPALPGEEVDNIYNIKNNANTFIVAKDQSTPKAYKKSDLMFAKQVETAKTNDPIKLTFEHQLTKIKVILQAGAGVPDVTDATITMLNVKKTIGLTMPTSDYSQNITLGEAFGATGSIDFGTVDKTNGNAIIIVPQTVTKGTKLFEVSYNGGTYSYTLPNGDGDSGVTFAAKTEYTYTLTLTSRGLTVTSTKINAWGDGGNTNGEATLN